jgi:hypothetical protein
MFKNLFHRKRRPFSNLELILAAVAVGSLFMSLYFGWQIRHLSIVVGQQRAVADTANVLDDSSTPSPKPLGSGFDYARIPQWGIRFQYSGDLAGVYFQAQTNMATDTVGLSSTQMLAKDGACDAANSALGTLTKYAPDSVVYGRPIQNHEDAISVGHYYYLYSKPTVSCSLNTDAQSTQTDQANAISADIKASLEFDSQPLEY